MHPNVHWSSVCNSKDMEAPQMSIDKGMDKESVHVRSLSLSFSLSLSLYIYAHTHTHILWNITQSLKRMK